MKKPIYPQSHDDPLFWSKFHETKYDDPDNTLALDFESYYDPNEYSVSTMGAVAYANDERADIYLLSAEGFLDGEYIAWAGHPDDFPYWERLRDPAKPPVRLLAANAEFEETMSQALLHHRYGWSWEDIKRIEFLCVLDLARFMGLPGSLAGAIKESDLADTMPAIDKETRTELAGKRFAPGEKIPEKYLAYCLTDSVAARALWEKYRHGWSDFERWYSVINRRRNVRGVPTDPDKLEDMINILCEVMRNCEEAIPWEWGPPLKTKTPTADGAFREYCRSVGIYPPPSLAEADPRCVAFEAEYGEKYPWINARRDWRKANIKLKKLRSFRERLLPNGQMAFEQRYFGAHTGRGAGGRGKGAAEGGGGAGVNMQNLAKKDFYGVNERNVITAPPGHVFLISDYAQIEPRLLYLRAGMTEVLDVIRSGVHIYEAHARLTMGYEDPRPLKVAVVEDPDLAFLYALAKARVIGLGYGCGVAKFVALAAQYGLDITLEKSKRMVWDFRNTNPKVPEYWRDHDKWLGISASQKDETHDVRLLSGRKLSYGKPRFGEKPDGRWGVYFRPTPHSTPAALWGGVLTENEIQATAMDVLRHGLYNLRDSHLDRWIMDIHDEVVFCLPERHAEELKEEIESAMVSIPWLPRDFPLEIEGEFSDEYAKI